MPPYSAAKHQGKPLYALARSGKELPEKTKEIQISHAEVLDVNLPFVRFRVACSSGTYIRSLAHSLGKRLDCGACLTELVREYSHPFALEQAHTLDSITQEPECLPTWVLPITSALPHWPTVALDAAAEAKARNGMALPCAAAQCAVNDGKAVLTTPDGAPLALAQACLQRGQPVWTIIRGLW